MQEVRAKKALGQHFLTDENIARRIAGALSGGGDVLEVGCGTGMLTQFLLERTDITLYGAEVDGESIGFLHRQAKKRGADTTCRGTRVGLNQPRQPQEITP